MDRWLRTSFLYTAATTMLVIGALYLAEHILAPLAVAVLLSIVLSGAVTRVETLGFGRWRLGRIAAVLVVAIGISAAFGGTGWIVVNEGSALVEQVPAYQRTLQGKIREPIDGIRRIMRQVRRASISEQGAQPISPDLVPRDAELVGFAAGWLGSIASFAALAGVDKSVNEVHDAEAEARDKIRYEAMEAREKIHAESENAKQEIKESQN